MLCIDINITETTYSCQFQYVFGNKWVIAVKVSNFSGQYLRKHWTLDIGVLGYIVIVWPKEHCPEVRSFPPGTPCIYIKDFFLCLPCWSVCEIFSVQSLILTVYCQDSLCFITKIVFFYIKHFDFLMWYSLIWIVLVFCLHNTVWSSSYKIIICPLNRSIQTTSRYYFHVRCEGGSLCCYSILWHKLIPWMHNCLSINWQATCLYIFLCIDYRIIFYTLVQHMVICHLRYNARNQSCLIWIVPLDMQWLIEFVAYLVLVFEAPI